MTAPSTFVQWFKNLPIPWLTGRTNGIADGSAQGTVYDNQAETLRQAVKQRMPSYCADDALPHTGGDRGLIQGGASFATPETNDDFRTRQLNVFSAWGRASSPGQLLYQLQVEGYTVASGISPVIVYQNGAFAVMTGDIGTTDDPALFVNVDYLLGTLGTALTSNTYYRPLPTSPMYSVPSGIPWWTTDSSPELCSRFYIIFQINPWSPGSPTDSDLSRLRSIIDAWKPGEAKCMGVVVIDSGDAFDWPVRTFTSMSGGTFNDVTGTLTVYPVD